MKKFTLLFACVAGLHGCVTLTDSDFVRIGQIFNQATSKSQLSGK